jgi:hypothetical protein
MTPDQKTAKERAVAFLEDHSHHTDESQPATPIILLRTLLSELDEISGQIGQLRRLRDDLRVANNQYLERARTAEATPEALARAETAWLIEQDAPHGSPVWFTATGPQWRFSRDANDALRFARKADAETFIHWLGGNPVLSNPRATEHAWLALSPSPATQPCFECGSTERVGTACAPCNPELTSATQTKEKA